MSQTQLAANIDTIVDAFARLVASARAGDTPETVGNRCTKTLQWRYFRLFVWQTCGQSARALHSVGRDMSFANGAPAELKLAFPHLRAGPHGAGHTIAEAAAGLLLAAGSDRGAEARRRARRRVPAAG